MSIRVGVDEAIPKKQEVFDIVARHLFAQGRRSMHDTAQNMCAYRRHDGCKCAAGVLIPDDEYVSTFECLNAEAVARKMSEGSAYRALHNEVGSDFILALQYTHDEERNWVTSDAMRDALAHIAVVFYLDTAVLPTLSFGDR